MSKKERLEDLGRLREKIEMALDNEAFSILDFASFPEELAKRPSLITDLYKDMRVLYGILCDANIIARGEDD